MAEIRIAKIIGVILLWYLRLMIPAFTLFAIFVLCLFCMSENWDELCEIVYLTEPYDFVIDENHGCQIQWLYFFREAIFSLSFVGYVVIAMPYLLKKLIERKLS